MARTTGPILAVGGVTMANQSLFHNQPIDLRIPAATALAAAVFALGEKAAPDVAVGIAWIALVTVLLTRTNPNVPAPLESLATWLGVPQSPPKEWKAK